MKNRNYEKDIENQIKIKKALLKLGFEKCQFNSHHDIEFGSFLDIDSKYCASIRIFGDKSNRHSRTRWDGSANIHERIDDKNLSKDFLVNFRMVQRVKIQTNMFNLYKPEMVIMAVLEFINKIPKIWSEWSITDNNLVNWQNKQKYNLLKKSFKKETGFDIETSSFFKDDYILKLPEKLEDKDVIAVLMEDKEFINTMKELRKKLKAVETVIHNL